MTFAWFHLLEAIQAVQKNIPLAAREDLESLGLRFREVQDTLAEKAGLTIKRVEFLTVQRHPWARGIISLGVSIRLIMWPGRRWRSFSPKGPWPTSSARNIRRERLPRGEVSRASQYTSFLILEETNRQGLSLWELARRSYIHPRALMHSLLGKRGGRPALPESQGHR